MDHDCDHLLCQKLIIKESDMDLKYIKGEHNKVAVIIWRLDYRHACLWTCHVINRWLQLDEMNLPTMSPFQLDLNYLAELQKQAYNFSRMN